MDSLPFAYHGPVATGRVRVTAADFRVEELATHDDVAGGNHVLLWIEKRGLTTHEVVRRMVRLAGVHPRNVGYAGLKDRNAVTRQWLSIQLPAGPEPDWSRLGDDELVCLETRRAKRKLRPGDLNGNRFSLRVRGAGPDCDVVWRQLSRILSGGMPNYFGTQRFGRDGRNLERARRLLAGHSREVGTTRGLLISAARAHLFNLILAQRVADGSWDRLLPGDIVQLDGEPRRFGPVDNGRALANRVVALDLHPTGTLWGRADAVGGPSGVAAARQSTALAGETALCEHLERLGVRADQRPLRVRVGNAGCERDGDDLMLRFDLPPGSYATVLTRELFEDGGDRSA